MSEDIKISIGRFSLITKLTPKALRLYDRKNILVPAYVDPLNNYRYYTTDQIQIGLKVKLLSWMGFGLSEISDILDIMDDPDKQEELEDMFAQRLTNLQVEISRLKKVEEFLLDKKGMEALYITTTEPTVKEIPALRVISKTERGPVGPTAGKLIGEIAGEIYKPDNQRNHVSVCGAPMMLMTETAETEVDLENYLVEMAFPITGKVTLDDDFELKNLPQGKVVSVIHTGPYGEVGGAYTKLIKFVEAQHYQVAGPWREIYLNNPQEVPEDELLTEIQIPIL